MKLQVLHALRGTMFTLVALLALGLAERAHAQAIDFDGSDDHLFIGDDDVLAFEWNQALTIEAWVRTTDNNSLALIDRRRNIGDYRGYLCRINNSGQIYFSMIHDNIPQTSLDLVTTNGTFNDGDWHHVAVSYDGSGDANNVSIYQDGVLLNVNINHNNLGGATTFVSGWNAVISGEAITNNQRLDGELDEFRIWTTARSQTDIVNHMNCELTGSESDLLLYYNFTNGSVTPNGSNSGQSTVVNQAGNAALNGTLTNLALSGTSSNWVDQAAPVSGACGAGGPSGFAVDLDGSNDHIFLGNASALAFEWNQPLTIEAWVRTTDNNSLALIDRRKNFGDYRGYLCRINNSGQIYFSMIHDNIPQTSLDVVTTNASFNDGSWHHVAVSYDGSGDANNVSIYQDGVLLNRSINHNNLGGNSVVPASWDAVISGEASTNNQRMDGELDEFRIWTTARSQADIAASMNCQLTGAEANLLLYYDFETVGATAAGNNGGLTTITDGSGNGIHGTLTNLSLSGTTSNYVSQTAPVTGTCESCTEGCTDSMACNYNDQATCDDDSCEYLSCAGCMDSMACNYDMEATLDDGSCEYTSCSGCMDAMACNFDPSATLDDGSCEYTSCVGCADPMACNFNADATTSDPDACRYSGDACDDLDVSTDFSMYDNSCNCVAATLSGNESESESDYAPGQYTLCQKAKADWVAGAIDYRFRFIPQSGGNPVVHVQGSAQTVRKLSLIDGLEVGETYMLYAEAGFDLGTGVPYWQLGGEGTLIEIIPGDVWVDADDNCSNHGPHSFGGYIRAKPFACGADKWEWTFSLEGSLPIVYTRNASNRVLRLSDVPGLEPGMTYEVTVRAGYPHGAFSEMSAAECISLIGSASAALEPTVDAVEFMEERSLEAPLTAACYPNPNTGNALNVNLTGVRSNQVQLRIFSAFGQLVHEQSLRAQSGGVNTLVHLNDLPAGTYLLTFQDGSNAQTERLIVR